MVAHLNNLLLALTNSHSLWAFHMYPNAIYWVSFEALLLVGLLHIINDEEIEMTTAALFSGGAAAFNAVVTYGLVGMMGFAGAIVAPVVTLVPIGVAVSAVFGVEIKRSFIIAIIFMVLVIGKQIGHELMFY